MTGQRNLNLGPLTRRLIGQAKWAGREPFPSGQAYADEIERLLSFTKARELLDQYFPRLSGKERGGALAELRVAYLLDRVGFQIPVWNPPGDANHVGEFMIRRGDSPSVFVEVKGPTWQPELTPKEQRGERKKAGKFVQGETRAVDSGGQIEAVIQRAVSKFPVRIPTLLAVADDFITSPLEWPEDFIRPQVGRGLSRPEHSRIGAVLLFWTHWSEDEISYRTWFIESPSASEENRIPKESADLLADHDWHESPR